MDCQQLWFIIVSILRLMNITCSRPANNCPQMDCLCLSKGRDEIDELFHASETMYTPLYDVERFKNVKLTKLQRYGVAKWQYV